MKKFITICISCSLALAAGAMAQQEEASATPTTKQQHQNARGNREAQAPGSDRAERRAAKRDARKKANQPADAAAADASAKAPVSSPADGTADVKATPAPHRKGQKASETEAAATTTPHEPATQASPASAAQGSAQGEAQAPAAPQANQAKPGAQKGNAQRQKPDVNAIKAQHVNFHAQPKPQQVPSVTFNQNIQISGSEHWQGEKYSVFRSYRPQMHDQAFYRSHYSRVELIGGGYYFFNAGYWYPAWGYQPTAQYYAYDGPIYAGSQAEPPDRVIADVQASLQAQGYYKGEVDGLLGPLTRQALTGYQTDNGLYATAAIDEPTLSSLGLG